MTRPARASRCVILARPPGAWSDRRGGALPGTRVSEDPGTNRHAINVRPAQRQIFGVGRPNEALPVASRTCWGAAPRTCQPGSDDAALALMACWTTQLGSPRRHRGGQIGPSDLGEPVAPAARAAISSAEGEMVTASSVDPPGPRYGFDASVTWRRRLMAGVPLRYRSSPAAVRPPRNTSGSGDS